MWKRILKIVAWVFLSLAGLLLLLSVLVYIPPVQNFIKAEASTYVSNNMGVALTVDRFRLGFPLRLRLDRLELVTPEKDTMLAFDRFRANIAVFPLFRGQLKISSFTVTGASVNYSDSVSGLRIVARLRELGLETNRVHLRKQDIDVGTVDLTDGIVRLFLSEGIATAKDTTTQVWQIEVSKIRLNNIDFKLENSIDGSTLEAILPQGKVGNIDADLGNRRVSVGSVALDQGSYAYLNDQKSQRREQETAPPADSSPVDQASVNDEVPWTISVERIDLTDNIFRYGNPGSGVRTGFDPEHIEINALNARVDSVYYSGSDIRAAIRNLSLSERSGIEFRKTSGRLSMDSALIRVADFNLRTRSSTLRLDAVFGNDFSAEPSQVPLDAAIAANLSMVEVFLFIPVEANVSGALRNNSLSVNGKLSGNFNSVALNNLRIEMPRYIQLAVNGNVSSLTDPEHMNGRLQLNGNLTNLEEFRGLIQDTALRNRIGFPDRLALAGSVVVDRGNYSPNLHLAAGSGTLDIRGSFNSGTQRYDARINMRTFPVYEFLPRDSLGTATLKLTARGRGFDLYADDTETDVNLVVDNLEYQGYVYREVEVDVTLQNHLLNGRIVSENEAARLELAVDGQIREDNISAHIAGAVAELDVYRLGFSQSPFAASLVLDARGSMADSTYTVSALLDSARIDYGDRSQTLTRTTVEGKATTNELSVSVRSGDMTLDFNSPTSLNTFVRELNHTVTVLDGQIDSVRIDMVPIDAALPPFTLMAQGGRNNLLNNLLTDEGFAFNRFNINARNTTEQPLRASMVVNGFQTGNLTLDTLNIGVRSQDSQLEYFLRLRNRPGNIEQMALIVLHGHVVNNTAQLNLYQRNRSDSVGFRFGLNGELLDSAVRISLFPENPILGFERWSVNTGNYVEYHFNREMYADLRLSNGDQHFIVQSAQLENISRGAVHVDISGIEIGNTLALLPAPPPLDGLLSTDLYLGLPRDRIAARGTVDINDFTYDNRKVGDVGLNLAYLSDSSNLQRINVALTLDEQNALTARGNYRPVDNGIELQLNMPGLPLSLVSIFLPEEAADLNGTLQGNARVNGTTQNMNVNGTLQFVDASIDVKYIGTTFGISSQQIVIENSIVDFENFAITSPNNQPLTIDGTIDFRDFARVLADMDIFATDFRVVGSSRNSESLIYGQADIDLNATAKGPLDALRVRADVSLLRGTDVTYTVQDSPASAESSRQDIVTFISFRDTVFLPRFDTLAPARTFGMDLLANIDIDDAVKANIYLNESGDNRIEVQGGGDLTYSKNTQGDSRFTGRYSLTSGTVVYSPPVISQLNFAVNDGSYVEWTGDIADPNLNVTATRNIRTTVTDDSGSRTVTFNVTVRIENTLDNLALVFDLSAPSDIAIQNGLSSMTAEERSTQAVSLMIYGQYTGPGSSAKIDTSNPVNSFIERELNQWARNSLQGVDLSFGIDSYDDSATGGGTHTDYSYRVSKSFADDRITVTVGGSLNSDADPTDNITNNFVEDVELEYRLNDRDNMFLKAFRHNTQESILEGEVVETGVGFVARKKMNKLRELFRFSRSPQKKDIRERQRAIRREQEIRELQGDADPETVDYPENE